MAPKYVDENGVVRMTLKSGSPRAPGSGNPHRASAMWNSYEQVSGMSGYYLEDSYVLSITQSDAALVFDMDVVLTERHPEFREPEAGEQYCYRRGRLVFDGFREIRWIERSGQAFTDASGEVDYGNIDAFRFDDDGYTLEGDWGEVYVAGGYCRVEEV